MKQIYQEYKDCLMPRPGLSRPVLKPHFALMFWPNGKPCTLVNFWLTDMSSKSTGKTVKQYAVWITPYIRYCFDNSIELADFSDGDMNRLIRTVVKQKVGGVRVKENDAVNLMIDSIVSFLTWLQTEGNPTDHKGLVGLAAEAPNLVVVPTKSRFGKVAFKHVSRLAKSTPEHKKVPMPRSVMSKIEDQVFLESDPETFVANGSHKFTSGAERMIPNQRYLYERRVISLWLYKRTGLRTEELSLIPLSDNADVASTMMIWLPTKKKRTDDLDLRGFKLTAQGALTVQFYIDERNVFVEELKRRGKLVCQVDRLLLTEDGDAISAGSITRDFSRLVSRAGLSDVRACLSMFRHRFITMEVMAHMKELLQTDKPTRGMLNDPVIKSIEERVRKKTGHKLAESIWHYFDAAFDMMQFWGSVDKTLDQVEKLEDIEDQMNRLQYNLRGQEGIYAEQLMALRKEVDDIRRQLALAN